MSGSSFTARDSSSRASGAAPRRRRRSASAHRSAVRCGRNDRRLSASMPAGSPAPSFLAQLHRQALQGSVARLAEGLHRPAGAVAQRHFPAGAGGAGQIGAGHQEVGAQPLAQAGERGFRQPSRALGGELADRPVHLFGRDGADPRGGRQLEGEDLEARGARGRAGARGEVVERQHRHDGAQGLRRGGRSRRTRGGLAGRGWTGNRFTGTGRRRLSGAPAEAAAPPGPPKAAADEEGCREPQRQGAPPPPPRGGCGLPPAAAARWPPLRPW